MASVIMEREKDMAKWIDADANVNIQLWNEEHEERCTERMTIEEVLNLLTDEGCPPSIDIVLCKECVRYDERFVLSCRHHISKVHADDFCSYGERRKA